MANPKHLAALSEGVDAWNKRGLLDAAGADLSGADLRGRDLRGFRLKAANLAGADLRASDLEGADLTGADLSSTNLQDANLRASTLLEIRSAFLTPQLAGADLTGAKLPESMTRFLSSLEFAKGLSENARKLFFVLLAACLYCWLTLGTTTDLDLITNRGSSPLPIIQTHLPIVGFYLVAPLTLLGVFFYFQFYLQKLWEELSGLPAVFPDGRPLHANVDPWLLNDLVRTRFPRLNRDRPFLSFLQVWISVFLAWGLLHLTMLLFWGKYLRRHEWTGAVLLSVCLLVSVFAAGIFYRISRVTLLRQDRPAFQWRGMFTSYRGYLRILLVASALAVVLLLCYGSVNGIRSSKPLFRDSIQWIDSGDDRARHFLASALGVLVHRRSENHRFIRRRTGAETWAPRVLAFFYYSPFANLDGANFSQKRESWNPHRYDTAAVDGAQLQGANLRSAEAVSAFLQGADLTAADLTGANLSSADLRGAILDGAQLSGATLWRAKLQRARLPHANLQDAYLYGVHLYASDLEHANLENADLQFADLLRADLLGANLTKARLHMADLRGADLSSANLEGAQITHASVCGADFSEVEEFPTDLKSASDWEMAIYSEDQQRQLGLFRNEKYQRYVEKYPDLGSAKDKRAFVETNCRDARWPFPTY
jgi:uncharacterized protein YjbI with pentapeptide repeats